MGWKGTMRSMSAAMKAAERESQRRHKQLVKEQMIEEAADAVNNWQNYIHELISIHSNTTDDIDWREIANSKAPDKPEHSKHWETKANYKLQSFKPKFWDFLLGGSEKRLEKIKTEHLEAVKKDKNIFEENLKQYNIDVEDWQSDVSLAKRLLSGDLKAKMEVIAELKSISSEDLIGTSVQYKMIDNWLHIIPKVHADDVIPNFRRKQLQSGKLSETKMPVGEFNELYQDYVCSVALRVAGDVFGILPIEEVMVTCTTNMLNTSTGFQEDSPILSVHFIRETYNRLNLNLIDPSDSLSNFNHTMSFKRTKGFVPIEPLIDIN